MTQYSQIEGTVEEREQLLTQANNVGTVVGECTAYCNTEGKTSTDPLILIVRHSEQE